MKERRGIAARGTSPPRPRLPGFAAEGVTLCLEFLLVVVRPEEEFPAVSGEALGLGKRRRRQLRRLDLRAS